MSYFLDDDSSQIREIKDKLEKLQSDFLSTQFSVQLENIDSGQSTIPGANPSARSRGSGSGGGGGTSTIQNVQLGQVGLATVNIDLASGTAQRNYIMELTGDISVAFSNPPANTITHPFEFTITQTATAYSITWPPSVANAIDVSAPNTTYTVVMQTYDGGISYVAFVAGSRTSTGGGGGDTSQWSTFPAVSDVDLGLFDVANVDHILFSADSGTVNGVNNPQMYLTNNLSFPGNDGFLVSNNDATKGFLWTFSNQIGMQLSTTTLEKESQDQLARMRLYQDGSIPLAGNSIGDYVFSANRTNQGKTDYAIISGVAEDTSENAYEGGLAFQITRSGAQEIFMRFNSLKDNTIDMFRELDMNDSKISGLAPGVNPDDAVNLSQLVAAGGGSVFSDDAFTVQNNVDATKKLQFEVGTVDPGQTATIAIPNTSGDTMVTRAFPLFMVNKDLDDDTTRFTNNNNDRFARFDVGGISAGSTRVMTFPNKSGTIALLDDIIGGGGGGGGGNQISQGDSNVTVTDSGFGAITTVVDGVQKISVTSLAVDFDSAVNFGSLASHIATFQALADFKSDVIIGNSPIDDLEINSTLQSDLKFAFANYVDYGESTSSANQGFSGSLPNAVEGYVTVKVNGIKRKIAYYRE